MLPLYRKRYSCSYYWFHTIVSTTYSATANNPLPSPLPPPPPPSLRSLFPPLLRSRSSRSIPQRTSSNPRTRNQISYDSGEYYPYPEQLLSASITVSMLHPYLRSTLNSPYVQLHIHTLRIHTPHISIHPTCPYYGLTACSLLHTTQITASDERTLSPAVAHALHPRMQKWYDVYLRPSCISAAVCFAWSLYVVILSSCPALIAVQSQTPPPYLLPTCPILLSLISFHPTTAIRINNKLLLSLNYTTTPIFWLVSETHHSPFTISQLHPPSSRVYHAHLTYLLINLLWKSDLSKSYPRVSFHLPSPTTGSKELTLTNSFLSFPSVPLA